MAQHISQIDRIDRRILKITLDHDDAHTPVTIIVTYSPHQGYTQPEKQERWKNVQNTLGKIPKHHLTTWGADANGQLGRDETHPEKYHKIIGPLTKQTRPEKGNGVQLAHICQTKHMIPMNTWKGPNSPKKTNNTSNRTTTKKRPAKK